MSKPLIRPRDPNAAKLAANRRAFGKAGAIPSKKQKASRARKPNSKQILSSSD